MERPSGQETGKSAHRWAMKTEVRFWSASIELTSVMSFISVSESSADVCDV